MGKILERLSNIIVFQAEFSWPVWRERLETVKIICRELNLNSSTTVNRGEEKIVLGNGNACLVNWSDDDRVFIILNGESIPSKAEFETTFRKLCENNR